MHELGVGSGDYAYAVRAASSKERALQKPRDSSQRQSFRTGPVVAGERAGLRFASNFAEHVGNMLATCLKIVLQPLSEGSMI